MNSFLRHRRIRAGGGVKRFHCFPLIGEQTVAAHSWNVVAILYEICDPSPRLVRVAVHHDTAEYDIGDTPSAAKKNSPALKVLLDSLEDQIFKDLDLDMSLSEEDKSLLKIADLMEMLLFIYDQRVLGNRSLTGVFPRVLKWLHSRELPARARTLLNGIEQAYEELCHGEPQIQDHG